jgi:hypothetical protein
MLQHDIPEVERRSLTVLPGDLAILKAVDPASEGVVAGRRLFAGDGISKLRRRERKSQLL